MANAQILHVFQGDKRQFFRFPGIRLPSMEADFPKIGQPVIIYPMLRGALAPPLRPPVLHLKSDRLEPFDDECLGHAGARPFLECRQ